MATRLSATLIERLPSGAVRVYSGASVLCVFSSLNPLSIYRENNKPSGISYYDNAGNQYVIDLHQLTSIVGSGTVQTYNAVDTTSSSDEYVNKVLSCFEFISSDVAAGYAPGPTFVGGVVASYPNFASFPATGTESVIYIDESVPQAYIWNGLVYQLLIYQNVKSYASMALFPVTGTSDVLYVDLSTFTGYIYDSGAYHALGGGAVWGSITGTLSSQSDLVAALAAKFNNPTGTTSQYLRGDGSVATFPTIPAQFNPIAGTGMSITGTYPNQTFTNTAPDQTVSIIAGTGISVSGTYPNFTIVNTAPDQAISLTAGTGITITGTYPNFTITNSSPSSGGTVTAVTATSPVVSSGGTTPNISIPRADATTNGYLLNTDWVTFNNKFNTPTGTTLQYVRGDGSLATFPTIPTVTPAALTKTDDTNVTLTLGGSPTNALLQAVSIAVGWTGTLADSRIASASTWNGKQDAITLTTTGTSGAATFSGGILNIPNYSSPTTIWKTSANGTTIGTGTTAAGITYSQLITGGTFNTGDILRIRFRGTKSATNGNGSLSIYVNSTNSLTGATLAGIFTANTRFLQMKRDFVIKSQSSATEVYPSTSSNQTDDSSQSNSPSSLAINWSVDQYVIFAVTNSIGTDSMTGSYYSIEKL